MTMVDGFICVGGKGFGDRGVDLQLSMICIF